MRRCATWWCNRRLWLRERFCGACQHLRRGTYGYIVTDYGLTVEPRVATRPPDPTGKW